MERLEDIADRLAPELGINQPIRLAQIISKALIRTKIERGKLVCVRVNGLHYTMKPEQWKVRKHILLSAMDFRALLEVFHPLSTHETATQLRRVLDDFLAETASAGEWAPKLDERGRRVKRWGEKRLLVTFLALDWEALTGEQPIAYRDGSGEARGRFYGFTRALCRELGMGEVGIDAAEKWVKEASARRPLIGSAYFA